MGEDQLQVSFDVLVGDPAQAKERVTSLHKLGTETPIELPSGRTPI